MNRSVIDEYWAAFIKDTGHSLETKYIDCFHFCDTEVLANMLLQLVLRGQKRATTSLHCAYALEGDPVPQAGDLSIVTDWEGSPGCVIETTAVMVLPFSEMTFDICRREGEDDSLESWQKGHRHFFTQECEALGLAFHADMPVVFEDFRVVYPLDAADR